MSTTKPKIREAIEARHRFRKLVQQIAYTRARTLAERITPELTPMDEGQRTSRLTDCVHAELWRFFAEEIEPRLPTPDGLQWMEHSRRQPGGHASAAASATHSLRARFIPYADAEHARDPALRKAAIARAFCDIERSAKKSTVTRYLNDLW